MSVENRTWRELCEAACKEPDPEQLMTLVSELVKALDGRKLPPTQAGEQRGEMHSDQRLHREFHP